MKKATFLESLNLRQARCRTVFVKVYGMAIFVQLLCIPFWPPHLSAYPNIMNCILAGSATAVFLRYCSSVLKCPRCEQSLSRHLGIRNASATLLKNCPHCGILFDDPDRRGAEAKFGYLDDDLA